MPFSEAKAMVDKLGISFKEADQMAVLLAGYRDISLLLTYIQIQFSVALRPQRLYGILGAGNQGHSLRLSHSS